MKNYPFWLPNGDWTSLFRVSKNTLEYLRRGAIVDGPAEISWSAPHGRPARWASGAQFVFVFPSSVSQSSCGIFFENLKAVQASSAKITLNVVWSGWIRSNFQIKKSYRPWLKCQCQICNNLRDSQFLQVWNSFLIKLWWWKCEFF